MIFVNRFVGFRRYLCNEQLLYYGMLSLVTVPYAEIYYLELQQYFCYHKYCIIVVSRRRIVCSAKNKRASFVYRDS